MVTIYNLINKVALLCNQLVHDEKEISDWLPANTDFFKFEVETHSFKFTIHVTDVQHPSSVLITNQFWTSKRVLQT